VTLDGKAAAVTVGGAAAWARNLTGRSLA
jgi:hypothetical protein